MFYVLIRFCHGEWFMSRRDSPWDVVEPFMKAWDSYDRNLTFTYHVFDRDGVDLSDLIGLEIAVRLDERRKCVRRYLSSLSIDADLHLRRN